MRDINEFDFYEFLKTHETHLEKDKYGEALPWVHVSYMEIEEFISIIQPEYDAYPIGILQDDNICVNVSPVFDNWGFDIKKYKKCFTEDDWTHVFGGY